MDDLNNDKEVVYFQCEKTLKKQFYKVAQDKNLSPGALFRAFMRKVIKSHQEGLFNVPNSTIINEEHTSEDVDIKNHNRNQDSDDIKENNKN